MSNKKVTVYQKLIKRIKVFLIALIKLVLYLKDKLLELNPLDQSRKLRKKWEKLNEQTFNLYQQGAFTKGIAVAEQVLELDRYLWGKNHPNVATSCNNLALLYKSQGRYSKAEPLYLEAVAIDRQALPPNHPNLATLLNNLAGLYGSQGCYSEAEPLYLEAVDIDRQALPPNHPSLATHLNNLAGLLATTERPGGAFLLMQEALKIEDYNIRQTFGSGSEGETEPVAIQLID
jgi:tetratricopeptide (TPR) repeat protein